MFHLLLLFLVPLAAGHGGMLWPPSWQDGESLPIPKITTYKVHSVPPMVDPESGRPIKHIKAWLTDQAYLGGHGDQFEGVGNVTNPECTKYKLWCPKKKFRGLLLELHHHLVEVAEYLVGTHTGVLQDMIPERRDQLVDSLSRKGEHFLLEV